MDEHLRLLERQALLGDPSAQRALERERIRLGRGWHGEPLVAGLRAAAARGIYLWTPPRGYAIELAFVRESGSWISRRPISQLLFRAFTQQQGRARRAHGPVYVPFAEADAYAKWAGVALPRAAEWRHAHDEGALVAPSFEWVRMANGDPGVTPPQTLRERWLRDEAAFRVAVRGGVPRTSRSPRPDSPHEARPL